MSNDQVMKGGNNQSLSLSLSAESSMDRIKFGPNRKMNDLVPPNNQMKFKDVCKSFSSADKVQILESNRQNQNLVINLGGADDEHEGWQLDKDCDNIISIRDSNIERPTDKKSKINRNRIESMNSSQLIDSQLSPSQMKDINQHFARKFYASRQGARGISPEEDKEDEIQYI